MDSSVIVYVSVFAPNSIKCKRLLVDLEKYELYPENISVIHDMLITFNTPRSHVDAANLTYKAVKSAGFSKCTMVIVDSFITSYHACPTLYNKDLRFTNKTLYGDNSLDFKLIEGGGEPAKKSKKPNLKLIKKD